MQKKFHQMLPDWAYSSLSQRSCSQCKNKYSKEDIVAAGVRQLDKEFAMYVEHTCSYCGFRSLTTLGKQKEESLESLCYAILENIKKTKLAEKSRKLREQKSIPPMTDKEVTKFLKFVNKSEAHEDFLREIGVNPPLADKDSDDTG